MGMPPLDLFSVCPNIHVKRWFITLEQKERQLELAWAMKKRVQELLKEKAVLQLRFVEDKIGSKVDRNSKKLCVVHPNKQRLCMK